MIFQEPPDFEIDFDFDLMLAPLITITFLLILMVIMVYLFVKLRVFLAIAVVFIFSLVIGNMALEMGDLPFTPFMQIFFMLFQTLFFALTTINVFTRK